MMSEGASTSPRFFCFGLGYSGQALATALKAEGWRVAGSCRSEEKRRRLAQAGIEAFLFDRDRPLERVDRALAETTHLLSSVPPDEAGDPVIDLHFFDIARLESLTWVGYLSTTAVYGDRGGGWVDESSEPKPSGERGRRRLEAETRWLDLWHGFGAPVHIFRLAGIYGPGRSALDSVRNGVAKRVCKPGQVFSRIHVADLVGVLRASMAKADAGAIYNLCDDLPAPQGEVVGYACELLGVEPPPELPYEQAELSPMARSFYEDNKRVANTRIKEELGVTLGYPDYRAGLKALYEAGA